MPAGAIVVADPPNADFPQPSAIEIYECVGRPTEYVLSYGIDIADGTLPLLEDAAVGPDTILSVIAEVDDVQDCLVKGPVFAQSIKIAHGGEGSSVLVVGGDTRIAMDRASKAKVYPEGTDSDAVQSVFGPYHLTPDVVPTDGHYSEETHALVQRETDFELVQRLARQNGFLFWITAGVDGVETGHFKPPVLAGEPAAQLAINQADSNTITELAIDWNVHTASATVAKQIDLSNGDTLDGSRTESTLVALGQTALAGVVTEPNSRLLAVPADDVGALMGHSDGLLLESTFFITARCETTTSVAKKILRAHTLVEIVGAGTRHSGLYYCAAVRHTITDTEHTMDLTLLRNGWN
ncbi:MAG: hypothetical protein DMF87_27865 [Acidobacteria bacterium]|nr:MAG: hypothetical protein DMF87_27865 [Acidobacteriota bacterium]